MAYSRSCHPASAPQPAAAGLGLGWRRDSRYCHAMQGIGAVLIGIDGVLTVSWKPLDGAVGALKRLRAAALPLALVTNTTSRMRALVKTGKYLQGAHRSATGTPDHILASFADLPALLEQMP